MRVGVWALATLMLVTGCSSSTEPISDTQVDGFDVQLTVDTHAPVVGEQITATFTVRNTTDDYRSRTFPPGEVGPLPILINADLLEYEFDTGIFGFDLDPTAPHTLTLQPHDYSATDFHFTAQHAGNSSITMCFPKTDDGPEPKACVSTLLTITTP